MLPMLTPLNGGLAGTSVQVPPPPRFRAVVGKVHSASLNLNNPFRGQRGNTAAKQAGVRYERKAQEHLREVFGKQYYDTPLIHFRDDSGARTCAPDGLLFKYPRVLIVECKFQHMPEAWWQLRRLYEPVLRGMYGIKEVILLEVCRSYDPQTPFPEQPALVYNAAQWYGAAKNGDLGVYRWRP